MGWPRIVLIHSDESGIFLDRYTHDGQPAGDTWHSGIEEAKEQAAEEYDGMLGEWLVVPESVPDDKLVEFEQTVR